MYLHTPTNMFIYMYIRSFLIIKWDKFPNGKNIVNESSINGHLQSSF